MTRHKLTISHSCERMYEIMEMIAKRTDHGVFAAPVRYDGMEINSTTLRTVCNRIYRRALRGLSQQPSYNLVCEHDEDFILLKLMLA